MRGGRKGGGCLVEERAEGIGASRGFIGSNLFARSDDGTTWVRRVLLSRLSRDQKTQKRTTLPCDHIKSHEPTKNYLFMPSTPICTQRAIVVSISSVWHNRLQPFDYTPP